MREPMDEGDIAQDYQTRLNADALATHRHAETPDSAFPALPYCAWCEVEIPAARRLAQPGTTLCVDCQAAKERLAARPGEEG